MHLYSILCVQVPHSSCICDFMIRPFLKAGRVAKCELKKYCVANLHPLVPPPCFTCSNNFDTSSEIVPHIIPVHYWSSDWQRSLPKQRRLDVVKADEVSTTHMCLPLAQGVT